MGATSLVASLWPAISNNGDLVAKLLALCAAYLVMQFIKFIFQRRHLHQTFKRMKIDGPKPHLIHGHLYETRRQPYVQFAHKMHEKYGKTVGVYLGGDPYLLTKDLELIQQVFVAKTRNFYDRMNFYLNVDPVPDNLICQRGDRWRYMRKLLTPAFSNSKIKSSQFYRDAEQTVVKFMRQLEQNSRLVKPSREDVLSVRGDQEEVCRKDQQIERRETFVSDAYDRMAAVALDVIVKTAFHMDNMISFSGKVNEHPDELQFTKGKCPMEDCVATSKKEVFLQTVKQACRLGFNPLVELIFCFPFLDKPFTMVINHLYFGSIIKLLFDRLDYLVRRPVSSKPKVDGGDLSVTGQHSNQHQRRRIIDCLIEVLRERKITKSEFTGNAFVIVFAGFETTANALTFTLWLLAKHQHVQRKLRRELREILARVADKFPNETDKEQKLDFELAELATGCDYLEMVINESLRLYPPVPGLSCRQASTNCTLSNGMFVEKGVNIVPSVYSIHRDKSIWGERANEFEPERFEMLDVTKLNSAMFMPFGLGPRNCIGKAAAMHEMKIVIGRMVHEYSIEFCPGVTPEKVKLCSPINITITSAERIGLNFVKLESP